MKKGPVEFTLIIIGIAVLFGIFMLVLRNWDDFGIEGKSITGDAVGDSANILNYKSWFSSQKPLIITAQYNSGTIKLGKSYYLWLNGPNCEMTGPIGESMGAFDYPCSTDSLSMWGVPGSFVEKNGEVCIAEAGKTDCFFTIAPINTDFMSLLIEANDKFPTLNGNQSFANAEEIYSSYQWASSTRPLYWKTRQYATYFDYFLKYYPYLYKKSNLELASSNIASYKNYLIGQYNPNSPNTCYFVSDYNILYGGYECQTATYSLVSFYDYYKLFGDADIYNKILSSSSVFISKTDQILYSGNYNEGGQLMEIIYINDALSRTSLDSSFSALLQKCHNYLLTTLLKDFVVDASSSSRTICGKTLGYGSWPHMKYSQISSMIQSNPSFCSDPTQTYFYNQYSFYHQFIQNGLISYKKILKKYNLCSVYKIDNSDSCQQIDLYLSAGLSWLYSTSKDSGEAYSGWILSGDSRNPGDSVSSRTLHIEILTNNLVNLNNNPESFIYYSDYPYKNGQLRPEYANLSFNLLKTRIWGIFNNGKDTLTPAYASTYSSLAPMSFYTSMLDLYKRMPNRAEFQAPIIPACTDSDWTSALSPTTCPSSGQQTKTWSKMGQCEGGVSHPASEIISCTYDAPVCIFTYSDWGSCASTGIQTRTLFSFSPDGCQGTPILSQQCVYIPLCTESDWTSALSPAACPSSGQQTKTWSRIGSCSEGISHNATEIISCDYQAPACVYNYSDWGACSLSEIQTRTYTSSPENCQGTPITTQPCDYIPSCTESDWLANDSACFASNTLTRNWTKIGNCEGGIQKNASEKINCTYNPEAIICTNFTYSNWSECLRSGVRSRQVILSYPENCSGGLPITSENCTYVYSGASTSGGRNRDGGGSGGGSRDSTAAAPSSGTTTAPASAEPPATQPIQPIGGAEEKPSVIKKLFVNFVCWISNILDSEGRQECRDKYLS